MKCDTIREMINTIGESYDIDQPLDFFSKNTVAIFLAKAPQLLKLRRK